MACCPFFSRAAAVLTGPHNRAVDHRVLVIRITTQLPQHPLPYPPFRPATQPAMGILPVTKPIRSVAPGNAGTIAVENRFNEEPIVHHRATDLANPTRQTLGYY
ncbi:MAG: hypothetical protein K0S58_2638 [Nitrospira sp.]|nr:hypothetical protein [Nitrospira sp.]